MQENTNKAGSDMTIGYRFPRGGPPIFVCAMMRGPVMVGHAVVEAPLPGHARPRNIRWSITGGDMCSTQEEAEGHLQKYAERLRMTAVYVNLDGQECGLVQPGVPALDSIRAYIAGVAQADAVRADALQRALDEALVTEPAPEETPTTTPETGMLFVVHFNKPYRNATHYLGFVGGLVAPATDLLREGYGEERLKEALAAIGPEGWTVTWEKAGTNDEFLALQKRRNHARLCPLCKSGKE